MQVEGERTLIPSQPKKNQFREGWGQDEMGSWRDWTDFLQGMAIINPLNWSKTEETFRKKQISRVNQCSISPWEQPGGSIGMGTPRGRHVLLGREGEAAGEQLRRGPGRKMNVLGFPGDDRNLEGSFVQRAGGTKPLWVFISHGWGRGALLCSGALLRNFHNPSALMGSELPWRGAGIWGFCVGCAEQLHALHDT